MTASLEMIHCPDAETLDLVATGKAARDEAAAANRHAIRCGSCREALLALALAAGPGTDDEEALIARVLEREPVRLPATKVTPISRARPRVQRWAMVGAAAAGLAFASVAVVNLFTEERHPELAVLARAEARPLEGRLSLDLPHAPYRPSRGDSVGSLPLERALSRLVAEVGEQYATPLAAVYLYRGQSGDLGRAAAAIDRAPPGPERENDRGVILLASGRPAEAVEAFQNAVAARPNFPAARFNLGVALEAAGDNRGAARAFRSYLASVDVDGNEAAWVAEARARLAALERGK